MLKPGSKARGILDQRGLVRRCQSFGRGRSACLIEEAVLKRAFSKSLLGAVMWDQIQRRDVELARQKLAELRSTTIQRHAEELKQLDADEAEIDTLTRLAVAFIEKYGIERAPLPGADQSYIQITPDNSDLLIAQNISPNFRRFSGRMASD